MLIARSQRAKPRYHTCMFGLGNRPSYDRGMSLIDTLAGIALFVLVFTSLFAGARLAIGVIANNKAKTGALAVLNQKMEEVKSTAYADLGTVSGIPAGTIPQNATTTLNATEYSIRTLIQYVDLPQDGSGAGDTNGITADGKQVKVEVGWYDRDKPRLLSMVTTLAPKGVESVAGGGTLRINVFDALAQAVAGASVRVENSSLIPPVDVTTFTNSEGVVLFPGASAGSSYKVTVTKGGYSTDQTYDADGANPTPSPGHFTIAVGQTTTGSFSIDTLGSLLVSTYSPIQGGSFSDTFASAANIEASVDAEVTSGEIRLALNGVDYFSVGTARSTSTAPQYLHTWESASWDMLVPANTNATVFVYSVDDLGVATLVPDIVLPGNSAGYSASPISLVTVATSTYARLALGVLFETTDVALTPSLLEWEIAYTEGPLPLPNIPFTVYGAKIIGTDGGGAPIYKYTSSGTTGSSAKTSLASVEWDTYTIAQDPNVTGYDVVESCLPQPVPLSPGASIESVLTLSPKSTHSLLMSFKTASGVLLPDVEATVTRTGYSSMATSSSCGQVYIGGLTQNTYVIDATKSGYAAASTTVDVSGPTVGSLSLTPL